MTIIKQIKTIRVDYISYMNTSSGIRKIYYGRVLINLIPIYKLYIYD